MTETVSPAEHFVHALRNDFVFFCHQLWIERGWDKVAPLCAVQEDILRFMEGGKDRRGVLAPRGLGKTHYTAALVLYRALRDVNRRFLIVSKSHIEAKKSVRLIKDTIREVWFLEHLKPGKGDRDNEAQFDFGGSDYNRQPSITALGIEGQIPGNRAHTIIADDVETNENTKTVTARTELAEGVGEFESVLYPNQPDLSHDECETVYVGTFHHEESLYLAEANAGFEFRTWPLVYPEEGDKYINLAPIIHEAVQRKPSLAGQCVFPRRFDAENVAKKRGRGRRYFGMQHKLLCNLGESLRYPLRLRDLIVFPVNVDKAPVSLIWGQQNSNGSTAIENIPSLGLGEDRFYAPIHVDDVWAPYSGTIAFIDPSGRGDDKTSVAAIGHLAGLYHLKKLVGLPGGFEEEDLNAIALVLRDTKTTRAYVESNWGGGMFTKLFEPVLRRHFIEPCEAHPKGWACQLVTDTKITTAVGHKEERIISLVEPVTSTHRLIVDPSVAESEAFQFQFTRITRETGCLEHEDELDALAGCLMAWEHTFRQDPNNAANRRRREHEDEQERLLRRYATGITPPKKTNWIHARRRF